MLTVTRYEQIFSRSENQNQTKKQTKSFRNSFPLIFPQFNKYMYIFMPQRAAKVPS